MDVEIVGNCKGGTFSIMGEDRSECFWVMDYFKYFERILHQAEEDWPAVIRNIRRVR